MTAHFPEAETLHAALSLAIRAPSVHNSQPWRWRVGSHSLHLYADRSLHLEHTDPDGRDLIISCGAALNHCTIALTALGWQTKVHRLPNPTDPHHLASIEVHPSVPSEADIALAAAIPKRQTDRRRFSLWSVPMDDVARMGARAARMGVAMRQVETSTEFRAVIAQSVWQHSQDPEYLHELAIWSGRHASIAGVPARNAPESDAGAAVPGRIFAGATLVQPPDTSSATDRSVVLALGTEADDATARLRAGEATSVVLLTATALGLASCPITEPLEIAETRDHLQEDVFGMGSFPQMLIRIGWAPVNADAMPATPRRPLSAVATWLDGSPFS
jgi:nitroreductase